MWQNIEHYQKQRNFNILGCQLSGSRPIVSHRVPYFTFLFLFEMTPYTCLKNNPVIHIVHISGEFWKTVNYCCMIDRLLWPKCLNRDMNVENVEKSWCSRSVVKGLVLRGSCQCWRELQGFVKHLNVHQYGSLENISDDVTDVFCSLSDLLSEWGRSRASVCVCVCF